MKIEKLKFIRKKLKNKKLVLGSWMQISNISITELICQGPFDWIAIDMEHGNFSFKDLPIIIRLINNYNKTAFIRLGKYQRNYLEQCLECGADGIIFSNIENANELEDLISRSQYPPKGKRGVGHSISNLFGTELHNNLNNFKPFICAMIESKEGAQNIKNIMKVRDLDTLFIGPYDLSCSLGDNGNFNNPTYLKTIKEILSETTKSNISCGIHIIDSSKKEISLKHKKGFNFIAYKTDAIFFQDSIKLIK